MSLKWYRKPRLVILNPNATVNQAARAMETNEIGTVLVQHAGKLVGLVTDRDIALRAAGQGLDPNATPLSEVMTEDPIALSPNASRKEALELMKTRKIRRIPLVENGKAVGLVSLDDLLLDETATLDDLSEVVEAQIGEPGPAPSPRSPAARRSTARAEATYRRLINAVQEAAELDSFELAETATEVVLSGILRRLTDHEARDLLAQLPSLLRPKVEKFPPGPDTSINLDVIASDLAKRLDIDSDRARSIAAAVGSLTLGSVSEGEAEQVRHQLPPDMREAFSPYTEAHAESPSA